MGQGISPGAGGAAGARSSASGVDDPTDVAGWFGITLLPPGNRLVTIPLYRSGGSLNTPARGWHGT